ncbi:MAG: peptidyl-prolyl cis-trans isomerase [Holophagales bacterium]|nr:peptidyl-prolyl cis-trans isomerase [Holophagales bacterium]MXX63357.1 peptidyl-prolyl cis-trans isomerase [Holophagales bacterium]MYC10698.1 peptidyl-prolyl cis-trans isomerase [Holophagales bacterium]MYD23373.1 peptidyl-prolyl cis-trans isomerase [Holophagales bacterium]MYI34595.1 peptidyl-prolyl cis-trans isomerase [Holophagales bacterium]
MHSSQTGPWSRFLIYAASTVLLAAPSFGQDTPPRVALETSHGTIVLELNPEKAPITVENFLDYVDRGWYDGTIFHRVIEDFMIQGGGFTSDLQRKITRPEIENESKNGLSNERGTISMARTGDPHSATAQFFINHVDNDGLDGAANSWGYAVFGKVVEGIDVVDSIAKVETAVKNGMGDVPVETVVIQSAKRQ